MKRGIMCTSNLRLINITCICHYRLCTKQNRSA